MSLRSSSIALLLAVGLQSCTADPPATGTTATGTTAAATTQPFPALHYQFYLETSSSTDAYLSAGTTRFNSAINQLQAVLNTHEGRKSFSIYEIANVAYEVFPNATDEQVATYFSNLSKAAVDKHAAGKASRTTSDLSTILATVLNATGPDDLSVLVSDCVVDTKTNGSNLASQQSHLQTIVSRRFGKSPLAALILRDTSAFRNGIYYPPAGGSEKITGDRPYFIILLGPPTAITRLSDELAARQPFYAQSVLLGPKAATPAATLLPPAGGLEYYAADPESAKSLIAKKARRNGPANNFVLQVEADLSAVPATESYKMNPSNYEVTPAGYEIKVTAKAHGRYTHVLQLSNPTLGAAHTVGVKLKNSLPVWVGQYSSEDPGPISKKPAEWAKTYGLAYLIRGFAEGFNPTPYIFELPPVQVTR
ncbi:MAG: hypothetical protein EOP52_02345 [Sphingobacteriales bacterium]|nr:MAG: hypothetical protein EOP52_02345 [Sphingobacteriales bacterium]